MRRADDALTYQRRPYQRRPPRRRSPPSRSPARFPHCWNCRGSTARRTWTALVGYLRWGYVPTPNTVYNGIGQFVPGEDPACHPREFVADDLLRGRTPSRRDPPPTAATRRGASSPGPSAGSWSPTCRSGASCPAASTARSSRPPMKARRRPGAGRADVLDRLRRPPLRREPLRRRRRRAPGDGAPRGSSSGRTRPRTCRGSPPCSASRSATPRRCRRTTSPARPAGTSRSPSAATAGTSCSAGTTGTAPCCWRPACGKPPPPCRGPRSPPCSARLPGSHPKSAAARAKRFAGLRRAPARGAVRRVHAAVRRHLARAAPRARRVAAGDA